jgi:hypothetical protein
VLEAHDSGADVMRLVERRMGIARLRDDRGHAQGIVRPAGTDPCSPLRRRQGQPPPPPLTQTYAP